MSLSGCRSESVMMRGMVIDREEARLYTIAQVKAFLDGPRRGLRVPKAERYPVYRAGAHAVLAYAQHGRVNRGVLPPLSGAHDRALTPTGDQAGAIVPPEWDCCRHGAPRHAFPAAHRHGRGHAG